jgi:predicted  nucleic acid-binding Zn-ribbon protein
MDIYKVSQGSINILSSTSTSIHTVFARAKWVRKQHLLSVTTDRFHRMTDLPTLIKQSRDLERKIKKIKTRNANRDLVEKRKVLEVQIDQQTQKLNDINGNIQSSQKQMLDVCDELGEAARQVKRLSKYDRSDLEVVLVGKIVDSCIHGCTLIL